MTSDFTIWGVFCTLYHISIDRHHSLFKEVYREVGLLEILVTCVGRYPRLLGEMTLPEGDYCTRHFVCLLLKKKNIFVC